MESYTLAPDGDADIPAEALEAFAVPGCLKCGGVLKPDVVFFGDNVPAPRVADAGSSGSGGRATRCSWSARRCTCVERSYRFVGSPRRRPGEP